MKAARFKAVPFFVVFFMTVLSCLAAGNPLLNALDAGALPRETGPTLDSAQPDTLFYDAGYTGEWAMYRINGLWDCVRFTAPFDLELRSIYFVGFNAGNSTPAVFYIHANNNGSLGQLLETCQMPGTVQDGGTDYLHPLWNDFDIAQPLTFAANQDFFIVVGPIPFTYPNVGWDIRVDAAGGVPNPRYTKSPDGHYGHYSQAGSFMIRAGVAPITDQARGYVTLISAGPPEWHYQLNRVSGVINHFSFYNLCPGTFGHCTGTAQQAGWTVISNGDSLVFASANPVWSNTLSTFVLTNPTCSGDISWNVGDTTGQVEGPLPVELLSFEAQAAVHGVDLRFVTASENANAYFEIYRSESAGGDFTKIAQLESQGNSSTRHNYTYTDASGIAGKTYWYYLADVSLSGARAEHRELLCSARVLESAVVSEYALKAYPNPFNPATTVEFTLPETQTVSLKVFDVTGKLVCSLADAPYTAGRHSLAFDAGTLPSGIYLARLEAGSVDLTRKLLLVK